MRNGTAERRNGSGRARCWSQRRRVRASIDCSQLLHLPALNVVWQVSEPGFDGFDGFAHTAQQIRHGPVTILIQGPRWPYNHHIHILMKVKSFHKSSQNSWSSPILINCYIVSLCFYAYVSVSLLLKLFGFWKRGYSLLTCMHDRNVNRRRCVCAVTARSAARPLLRPPPSGPPRCLHHPVAPTTYSAC